MDGADDGSARERLGRLLADKRLAELPAMLDRGGGGVLRKLYALLFDETLGWRAVSAFGVLAEARPALVRRTVSRLAWSLNDEASTCGRLNGAALGEMAARNPDLTRQVVRIVVHYCEDYETCHGINRNVEVLCAALWAVGRVGSRQPELAAEVAGTLAGFMADPVAEVRGHALWALAQAGLRTPIPLALRRDGAQVTIYQPRSLEMESRAIAEWAVPVE